MTNAEKFKEVFGLYATETWAMPESDFLLWLNGEYNGEERKTGKWIPQYKEIPNMATFKCSCCGCVDEFAAKYCSNCGVRMEGVNK